MKASTHVNPVDIHICSFSHGGSLLKLLVDDKTREAMSSTPIFCGLLEIDSVLARPIISCSSLGECNFVLLQFTYFSWCFWASETSLGLPCYDQTVPTFLKELSKHWVWQFTIFRLEYRNYIVHMHLHLQLVWILKRERMIVNYFCKSVFYTSLLYRLVLSVH